MNITVSHSDNVRMLTDFAHSYFASFMAHRSYNNSSPNYSFTLPLIASHPLELIDFAIYLFWDPSFLLAHFWLGTSSYRICNITSIGVLLFYSTAIFLNLSTGTSYDIRFLFRFLRESPILWIAPIEALLILESFWTLKSTALKKIYY